MLRRAICTSFRRVNRVTLNNSCQWVVSLRPRARKYTVSSAAVSKRRRKPPVPKPRRELPAPPEAFTALLESDFSQYLVPLYTYGWQFVIINFKGQSYGTLRRDFKFELPLTPKVSYSSVFWTASLGASSGLPWSIKRNTTISSARLFYPEWQIIFQGQSTREASGCTVLTSSTTTPLYEFFPDTIVVTIPAPTPDPLAGVEVRIRGLESNPVIEMRAISALADGAPKKDVCNCGRAKCAKTPAVVDDPASSS
ncbi:hypothetical protein DFH09DRAFT_1095301 [Mycena vulgaris]|nr:hypothetical protein DFH09DRAFT_1095301 [Mycena vulgaris]